MQLFSVNVVREGKKYVDLYLAWTFNNKHYACRVRPVFASDNKLLLSQADELTANEMAEYK